MIHLQRHTKTREETRTDVLEDEGNYLILFNDDVNTFDHVISMLVKYCGHDLIQAEQCAWIVHHKGKCDVKHGSFDELKPMHEALLENGLTAEIH